MDGPQRRLLLVEDDPVVMGMFELMLKTMGWAVTTARDGQEGLDRLADADSDVTALLTDFVMPRMDGGELAERVRAHARYAELPILIITALPPDDRRLVAPRQLPRCAIIGKTDAARRTTLAEALTHLLG